MNIDWKIYDDACKEREGDWLILDETLYGLCRDNPRHSDIGAVRAKVWIIGRTYATQIERQISSDGSVGNSMDKLARHLHEHHEMVDGIFDKVRNVREPLEDEEKDFLSIVAAHGELVSLIQRQRLLRNNNSPHSFVSKYMHFHCPVVPIYDSNAKRALRKLVPWQPSFDSFKPPSKDDEEYRYFVRRFLELYLEVRKVKSDVTVRLLDIFLLLWWRKCDKCQTSRISKDRHNGTP